MKQHSSFGYYTIELDEDFAANCIYINGSMIHLSDKQLSGKTYGVSLRCAMTYRSHSLTLCMAVSLRIHNLSCSLFSFEKTNRQIMLCASPTASVIGVPCLKSGSLHIVFDTGRRA